MKHVRVATYTITKGTFDEISNTVSGPGGMLEIFRTKQGLDHYGLADLGDGLVASITVWDSRDAADASVELAAAYIKDELSDRLERVSSFVGDLGFWSN